MPELPEVESIRRALVNFIQDKLNGRCTLKKIFFFDVKKREKYKEKKEWEGKRILAVSRRGKYLFIFLESEKCVLIHLRLDGRLRLLSNKNTLINAILKDERKNLIAGLKLNKNYSLILSDRRHFASIDLEKSGSIENSNISQKIGPDFTSSHMNASYLKKIWGSSKARIKSNLLNQKHTSGIGNIYADEMLFQSSIHPASISANIPNEKMEEMIKKGKEIMNQSILDRGCSVFSFLNLDGSKGNFQNRLKAYGRYKKICLKCNKYLINRMYINGRSSHYCPNCQYLY